MHTTASAVAALKKELGKDLCVMGHHYQHDRVVAHCDITGDSLELARKTPGIEAAHIVFCGVYFMGESAALLAKPGAGGASARSCGRLHDVPDEPGRSGPPRSGTIGRATACRVVPLAYVNTTLALKAVVGEYGGAVCTSANAETMLRWALARGDGVLFLPDKHLGRNTAKKLGIAPKDQHILKLDGQGLSASESRQLDRPLLLWPGCCAIHARLKPEQAAAARAAHPGCRITAHPECRPELIDACDAAGSTSFLIADAARIAEEAPGSTLIIGTENNLVDRLAARHAGAAASCRWVGLSARTWPR